MGLIVGAIASNRAKLCKKAIEVWKSRGEFDEIWIMWDGHILPILEAKDADKKFWHDVPDPRCIPSGSGCCRSRLVLEAWKRPDVEWLVHLDDDVIPHHGSWRTEIRARSAPESRWFRPIGWPTRGLPYGIRSVDVTPKIVHGVWSGVPDFDAMTQLSASPMFPMQFMNDRKQVPYGLYFPMSSMAVAIHRDLFPASYFLWMGKDLPLNKFGDIWCGVILKRICDHFGWLVTSGAPVVYHERASNVWENLRQECKCIEENEQWWSWVDAVDLRLCSTVVQCYRQIATQMHMPDQPRFKELREKMLEWCELFE